METAFSSILILPFVVTLLGKTALEISTVILDLFKHS